MKYFTMIEWMKSFKNNTFFPKIGIYICIHRICLVNYNVLILLFVSYLYNTSCRLMQALLIWHFKLIIILSSDVHPSPGPPSDKPKNGPNSSFLTFCNWNVNTQVKIFPLCLTEANNTIIDII